jgi:outer membrane immunogenic protein
MIRGWVFAAVVSNLALAIAFPARAADMPVKAPLAPLPPSWTGFYVGAQVGGGWNDHTVNYTPNDPLAALIVNGTAGFPGQQPFAAHGLNLSGVTGGVEAGYNWQVNSAWLVGLEADFSGSGIHGGGGGTSILVLAAPTPVTQTVASEQKVDWWGTVRARLGWLARPDLLLYGTGGFAYGRVAVSDSLTFNGPPGVVIGNLPPFSFICAINVICFSGATSDVKYGWTAGAGGEWRVARNWSFKAEYLYVNLGNASVNAVANAVNTPGATPASYRANFGDTDFHVVRVGVNYHF